MAGGRGSLLCVWPETPEAIQKIQHVPKNEKQPTADHASTCGHDSASRLQLPGGRPLVREACGPLLTLLLTLLTLFLVSGCKSYGPGAGEVTCLCVTPVHVRTSQCESRRVGEKCSVVHAVELGICTYLHSSDRASRGGQSPTPKINEDGKQYSFIGPLCKSGEDLALDSCLPSTRQPVRGTNLSFLRKGCCWFPRNARRVTERHHPREVETHSRVVRLGRPISQKENFPVLHSYGRENVLSNMPRCGFDSAPF